MTHAHDNKRGWIAVDLDGTLAHYTGWKGADHIGPPVVTMVERVRRWLDEGKDVRIFTARVAEPDPDLRLTVETTIRDWCKRHLGRELPVTNVKDYSMVELYDDRAVTVEQNTGRLIGESQRRFTP